MRRATMTVFILTFIISVPFAWADWSANQRLTWTSGVSQDPDVAVDSSGNIHVVWHDNTPGNYEIYYKKSTDGGATWTAATRLTWNSGNSVCPAIVVGSSGKVHVVWCDDTPGNYDIYYKKSTDGGTTWLPSQRLTWSSGDSYNPDICVDPNGWVHVVYHDNTSGNNEIYYLKNYEGHGGGTNWLASKRLTWNLGDSSFPVVAADSFGQIHLVWNDDKSGNLEIYYKSSIDGGSNWMTTRRLTWTSGASLRPSIAITPPYLIHVAWHDGTPGNYEIYYLKSVDGGLNWSANRRLTWTSGDSLLPRLAADQSGRIHLVWQDDTPGNKEIYYKRSTDGGINWETGQNLTLTSGTSSRPAIAAGPSESVYVVWDEALGANWEIYYKKYE
jgi:hypothetical protein